MNFRLAESKDTFDVMKLYQKSMTSIGLDVLFTDSKKIAGQISSPDSIWFLTEINGEIAALVSVLLEREQRMAKISHLFVDSALENAREVLSLSLRHVLRELENSVKDIDLVYSTTLSVSMDMQEITLHEGFKIMGVFPNALGADNNKLNGLTVYYFKGVLEKKRSRDIRIHPVLKPFFEIASRQVALSSVEIFKDSLKEQLKNEYAPLAPLEIIRAPAFVENKFERLKSKHSQVVNFYPFYTPNTLITDPKQEIEIYVKINVQSSFAAIIGEHLEQGVHPVLLYSAVLQILRQNGVMYVEIINDAADVFGTECILQAGFTPCAYIPAFKRQGDTRRDYVVFGKSFEYLAHPDLQMPQPYLEFFKHYYKIERRNYFRKI